MLSIDTLKTLGANTEEGLTRCMGQEAFYFRMIQMVLKDGNFDRLAQAVEKGDLGDAFEAAHALKGVTGNVSLTPLYEALSDITERLRVKEDADYPTLLKAVLEQRDAFAALCED
ncbi:MAG: Hpt domain-containing protein [Firmicutes bacterium]|nr:Hpt domain-containing protein [Bacillota bacterium]